MISQQQLTSMLGQLHFLGGLPEDVLQELASVASLKGFPEGTVVFREGFENHDLYVVCAGRVALDMNVPGRGSIRIITLGPGDVMAWSALIGGGRMTTSAVALEDTQAVALPGPSVLALCERNHAFGYHLMRRMAVALSDRLVATRLQLLDLFAETSPETLYPANG